MPPEQVWAAGQLCESVVVDPLHVPPEQVYVVTERVWVPGKQKVFVTQLLHAP